MNKKTAIIILIVSASAYAGVYFYQRYKRNQANKTVSYEEAIELLDSKE